MNGLPVLLPRLCALNATLHIGTEPENRKPPKAIYGVFNKLGECLYVGASISPYNRQLVIRAKRRDFPRPFRLLVLRWADFDESDRLETQVILAYKRRGQAKFNRSVPFNYHTCSP